MRRLAVGLLLSALALAIYLQNGRFNESTDTFGNELLPISILEHGTLTFDQYFSDQGVAPGSIPAEYAYRVSPELPNATLPWWFERIDNHVVTLYPIVPGLLNVPVFWAAKVAGVQLDLNVVPLTHITTSVIAALSVLFIFLCLVQICQLRTAAFLTLSFAFATAVWSHNSRSINQHGTALLFITAALALLLARRPRLVPLAGLLLAVAVVTRPADLIVVAPIAVYVYRHHRHQFLPFVALSSLPALLLAGYSWAYWGTPFALGQGQGLSGFTAPEPAVALLGLLVNPNRGLLVFSPIFLFAIGCYIWALRNRQGPPRGFDDDPDNIDFNHVRLWDVATGEVARCTTKELDAWSARLVAADGQGSQT